VEADKESLALRSTEAPVADAPATTVPAESDARDEERVDLVILVKSADTTTAALGTEARPSGPAATAPIEKFEILTVTLGDDDATNVRVGEDGMIDLPPAGRIAAEGLTAETLGKRISESLGRTSADAKGKVTVSRPGAGGAATQPDGKPDGQSQTPTGTDSPQPQQPPPTKESAREEPSPAPTQD
jgi:protein involved in polysaccharide export with SLBB domain